MIELYNGDCRTFLSNYNGAQFDAVITDPPYASGGATLAERSASTSQKYTATKKACPFPDFMGDQMDARSWLHMMADVLALARVRCHDGAVMVAFCDWRQMPLLTDAVQWAGWQWRGTLVWDKLTSRPQMGRFRQQAEFVVWASNGKLPIDRPVPVLPGVFRAANVQGVQRIHQTQKPEEIMRQICKICRADESSTHLREAVRRWRRRSWKGTIRSAWSCPKKLQRARRSGCLCRSRK